MSKTAFVFPGQGAQYIGMGKELYQNFDSAKRVFDIMGDEVKQLAFSGPKEDLNLTINAQPCLFAADLATAAALNEQSVFADGVAGFSLGEVPALVHSGLLTLEQGALLVNFRAEAMHRCALQSKGGMAAVLGLEASSVVKICVAIEGAYPANFNCNGQTVVAFAENCFEELKKKITENRGKIIRLKVNGAFHSPFMNKAKEDIEKYLEAVQFGSMEIPLYSNETALINSNPKGSIARQVISPVLWQKTIENMIQQGFDTFIEAGPGKTLTGLIKKINKEVRTFNVFDLESLENTVQIISKA